ncbi:MAG: Ig-like domain-containing protein [Anaeromyxobacteraceae bacterium]
MSHSRARTLVLILSLAVAACGGGTARTLTSLVLSPSGATVAKGLSTTLTATGTYSDGSRSDLTSSATWTSSDASIASIVAPGRASARAAGTATISAQIEGVTDSVPIIVGPALPIHVNVTPATATVPKGLSATFEAATFTMTDGSTEPVTGTVTWSTSRATVATVDAAGKAQGVDVGTSEVVASARGVTGQGTLTVAPPIPLSIVVTPPTATVVRGGRQQYMATGAMSDATVQDVTTLVTWTTGNAQVASILVSGMASGGPIGGTTFVRASTESASGDAAVEVMPQRVAFVTSRQGTGNLASWGESGGKTGLAAADAICQALASSARLHGTFRAWMSDPTSDAYCRIQGLDGKRSSGCGVGPITTAGPWVGMDGQPFAPNLEELVLGKTIQPLRRDELGHLVPDGTRLFTSTLADGTVNTTGSPPCGNWSQIYPPASPMGGIVGGAESAWTDHIGVDCSLPAPLACLEVAPGGGAPLPPFTSTGRIAFVTSASGVGNLSTWPDAGGAEGIAAGDAICRAAATRAGLPRADRFKAWLSTTTLNAVDRLASDGPWVRVDGAPVASSRAGLASGFLYASISVDENGRHSGVLNDPTSNWTVWTGSDGHGQSTGRHCGDWKVGDVVLGTAGLRMLATETWTTFQPQACASYPSGLYCIED